MGVRQLLLPKSYLVGAGLLLVGVHPPSWVHYFARLVLITPPGVRGQQACDTKHHTNCTNSLVDAANGRRAAALCCTYAPLAGTVLALCTTCSVLYCSPAQCFRMWYRQTLL